MPLASEGGPDKLDNIEGVVRGAHQGARLVLYAKAGSVWWIQPLSTRPFTPIASDGVWKTPTHLGTEFGAILVDPGYVPASTLKKLPPLGSGVTSVATKSIGPAHWCRHERSNLVDTTGLFGTSQATVMTLFCITILPTRGQTPKELCTSVPHTIEITGSARRWCPLTTSAMGRTCSPCELPLSSNLPPRL